MVGEHVQLCRTLRVLIGAERITSFISDFLQDALAAEGSAFRPFSEEHRSTILSVPVKDTGAVVARFREAKVVASVREGRIRLAVHFYNLEDELDRVAGLIGRG